MELGDELAGREPRLDRSRLARSQSRLRALDDAKRRRQHGPRATMNLGRNVRDDAAALAENRRRLQVAPARGADVARSGARRGGGHADGGSSELAESRRRRGGHARTGRRLRGPHRRLPAGALCRSRRQCGGHRPRGLARTRRGRTRSDDRGARRSRRESGRPRRLARPRDRSRPLRSRRRRARSVLRGRSRGTKPASRRTARANGTPISMGSRERASRAAGVPQRERRRLLHAFRCRALLLVSPRARHGPDGHRVWLARD